MSLHCEYILFASQIGVLGIHRKGFPQRLENEGGHGI